MVSGSKRRHLIFLFHLWALVPLAIYWPFAPEMAKNFHESPGSKLQLMAAIGVTLAYLIVRTVLAWRDSNLLKWDFIFPPIDVLIISWLVYVVESHPLGNLGILYLLPIVEAAANLNWRLSLIVGALVVFGSLGAATLSGAPIPEPIPTSSLPLNVFFRFYFMLIMASLITLSSKQTAEFRSQLRIEADRNRLALEMHDGLQGSLITAASQVELAQTLIERDPARATEVAAETRQTLRQATDELRFLVQRLRKNDLVGGFEPALRQYANNICERNKLQLEFEVDGNPAKLGAESENALFRIAQEAVTNVLKHAQASKVGIRLRYEKDTVHMTISDNGVGFTDQVLSVEHSGLEGMRERANERHGTLSVKHLEHGTKVSVSMPRSNLWTRKFV
jgi:signal transduction histidine kinase